MNCRADELVPGDWLVGHKRDESISSQIVLSVTQLLPNNSQTPGLICIHWLENGEIHHVELLPDTLIVKDDADADGLVKLLRNDSYV
jgi:hypothetical protein